MLPTYLGKENVNKETVRKEIEFRFAVERGDLVKVGEMLKKDPHFIYFNFYQHYGCLMDLAITELHPSYLLNHGVFNNEKDKKAFSEFCHGHSNKCPNIEIVYSGPLEMITLFKKAYEEFVSQKVKAGEPRPSFPFFGENRKKINIIHALRTSRVFNEKFVYKCKRSTYYVETGVWIAKGFKIKNFAGYKLEKERREGELCHKGTITLKFKVLELANALQKYKAENDNQGKSLAGSNSQALCDRVTNITNPFVYQDPIGNVAFPVAQTAFSDNSDNKTSITPAFDTTNMDPKTLKNDADKEKGMDIDIDFCSIS